MPTATITPDATSELEQLTATNRARLKGTKREEPHDGYLLPLAATGLPKTISDANRAAHDRLAEHHEAAAAAQAATRALRDAATIDRRAIDGAVAAGDDPPESVEPARRRDAEIADRRRMLARERAWHAIFVLHDAIIDARRTSWPQQQHARLRERTEQLVHKQQEIDDLTAALNADRARLGIEYAALDKIEHAEMDRVRPPDPRRRR